MEQKGGLCQESRVGVMGAGQTSQGLKEVCWDREMESGHMGLPSLSSEALEPPATEGKWWGTWCSGSLGKSPHPVGAEQFYNALFSSFIMI